MKTIRDVIAKIEVVVSGTAFVVLVGVVVLNVFSRFILLKSFAWTEEIAYLCFNWSVFFGVCILYRNQGLISIDAVVDRLPPKARHIVRSITFAMIFVMCAALTVWGWKFSVAAWIRPTAILQIPYFFVDVSIPLACAIMAGYSVDFFIRSVRGQDIQQAALEERA